MTSRSAVETLHDMSGQDKDVPGRLKDTPDGYTDLVDTHGWGLQIIIFLADDSL